MADPFATNPYVGPRAFRLRERNFYGRAAEIRELTNLVTSERVLLMHAPSGAGKTSLIQAGLIPVLERDFEVLPILRVGRLPLGEAMAPGINRYVWSIQTCLSDEPGCASAALNSCSIRAWTLAETLEERSQARAGSAGDSQSASAGEEESTPAKPELLIFDQFEEVLTIDPYDVEAKQEFFIQLAQVLKRPCNREKPNAMARWALFAMRDEYVAALQPYLKNIPSIWGETFRLDLLSFDGALAAIRGPAEACGVRFTEAAALKLVKNLSRKASPRTPIGDSVIEPSIAQATTEHGTHIEPVQLQVVCYRLWNALAAESKLEVTEADIDRLADVDNALGGYYAEKIAEACAATGIGERRVREWFESRLITPDGLRAIVQRGAMLDKELPSQVIEGLLSAFLIRSEEQKGMAWLELSHDRLIEPIRQNNWRWFQDRLHPFQFQARQWSNRGEPEKRLLSGTALEDAKKWARRHQDRLQPLDERFLKESEESLRFKDHLRMAVYKWWAVLSSLALVTTIVMMAAAAFSLKKASHEAELARKAERIAKTQSKIANDSYDELASFVQQSVDNPELEKASRLATAQNATDAQAALEAWRALYARNGIDEEPAQWGSRDLKGDWERVEASLSPMTLEYAQTFRNQMQEKNPALQDDRLIAKLQEKYFPHVTEVAQRIANAEDLGSTDTKRLIDRFWELYYGILVIFEGQQVTQAMINYGNELRKWSGGDDEKALRQKELSQLAKKLKEACNQERRATASTFR